jgi:hypothetical protein
MPQAIVLYLSGSQLLLTGVFYRLGWKTPMSLSSTRRDQAARPGVFMLVEDVIAVDGGGGTVYRNALIARYEASPYFRTLLQQLNWFWGIGSLAVAVITSIAIYVVDSGDVAFALGMYTRFPEGLLALLTCLGWTLCWVWGGIGALVTTYWAKRALRHEKRQFVLETTAAIDDS